MTTGAGISIARVYDADQSGSRTRLLVDRIWPRGMRKGDLNLHDWVSDVAPSTALRVWFGHDPARWNEFQKRYRKELANNPGAVSRCLDWCRKGPVVLLYSARDRDHNQAIVLRDYLSGCLQRERPS